MEKQPVVIENLSDTKKLASVQAHRDYQRRYETSRREIVNVYKVFLEGVPIDELKASNNVKNIIKEFERYSTFTAYQIAQMSSVVDSDTAAALRKLKKLSRRAEKAQQHDSVEFVVKKKLEKVPDIEIQRQGVKVAALYRGKTLIKMAKAGKSPSEIAKTVSLGEYRVKKILENVDIKAKV